MTLLDLGWNDAFEAEFAPYRELGWEPARLLRDNKISYGALVGDGEEYEAILSGKVYHDAKTDADLPAVGDWVALDITDDDVVIRARLERQSCFSRKTPGKSAEEQVIAANVNVVVVVTDAGTDFSLHRMERYFTLIHRSGARPVVMVNKSDLFTAAENKLAAEQIQALNPDAEVMITSVIKGTGLKALRSLLKRGVTLTLIGSSGVGKSALVNRLLGDEYQWTGEVNEVTGKGRHTTTARELMILPKGGILIDNPGIKEVQMWTDETTLRDSFRDLEDLSLQCKFADCKHGTDTGCAVRGAVERQELSLARYESFLKLEDEIEQLRKLCRKRQMTLERRAKRDHKIKARNRSDREAHEFQLRPRKDREIH
jgi:ribosome biogenesis GTPase